MRDATDRQTDTDGSIRLSLKREEDLETSFVEEIGPRK
jgi:hypothetical protein